MVEKYKQRVAEFITSLETAPIVPPDEYLTKLKQQETNRSRHRYMGNESMMYSVRTEKDRIDHVKNEHDQLIDSVPPQEHGLKLRPIEKEKEIVPPLRYTFRGDMERIYDKLNNNAYPAQHKSITEKDFERKMNKFKRNFRNHLNNKSTSEKNFLKPKKIFGELHRKTHFNAAYSIYLNYNTCLQDKAAKEIRKEDDLKEEFRYRTLQDEPYRNIRSERDLVKSYDANVQRNYEDFDMETNDSVIQIEKENHKHSNDNLRKSHNVWLHNNQVKSLSPDFGRYSYADKMSMMNGTNMNNMLDILKTRQSINTKKENLDSAKENYRSLRHKTKSALENSNFLRRKHYKGDTLWKGEGKLFMNKGVMDNLTYNQFMVKPVVTADPRVYN